MFGCAGARHAAMQTARGCVPESGLAEGFIATMVACYRTLP
jgi:hypothetical protein